ncbi:MAG: dihydrolipoyl dehydrogenase [Rhodospirillales bacterium]|jgi:dihydrolipoamide dehydrogenase|nr:dihydrolipoyl dehydrogenase [Rhodospirillales bacterium]
MSNTPFDLVVIGGGPGGYVAAIRAAQLGLNVACVEARDTLGGTCLNVGCIPSKALLQSSHHYAVAKDEMAAHGVQTGEVKLDLPTMMARKDKVVGDLTKGIDFLLKKNKVTRIVGRGVIKDASTVTVGKETLKTKNILIATGSESTPLPGIKIDEKRIVTSTGALALPEVPKKLIVIGAGIIGLELGSVWRRLGAEVTVIEFLDAILPGLDGEVVKQMTRTLKKQGLKFQLSRKVTGAKASAKGVTLTAEPVAGGEAETYSADVVLVAVGRRPFTEGLGLKKAGVAQDKYGFVTVDENFATSVPGIYAIGDVIGGMMLAHKAEDEGVAAAEIIAGEKAHVNYSAIPGVVYTWPEAAGLGKTEEALKQAGVDYKVGKFPFSANSRARCNADSEGFVKILADAKTDAILGVHIVGPEAGDLIQEAVIAMEFSGSAEDLARSCHGHPGLSEAVKEAALAVGGRAIHS